MRESSLRRQRCPNTGNACDYGASGISRERPVGFTEERQLANVQHDILHSAMSRGFVPMKITVKSRAHSRFHKVQDSP